MSIKPNMLLTLQERIETDPFDKARVDWSDVRSEWFSVRSLSGSEYTEAQQIQSKLSHNGTSEPMPDATTAHRLLEKSTGRVFNIEAVVDMSQNRKTAWRLIEVV